MKIRPLFDRVVVRRKESAAATTGGIIIPENAKEKPTRGEVVAIGPGSFRGNKFVETTVRVGDTVLFTKYSGTDVVLDDEDHLVIREDDILAVVEEETKKGK